MATAAKKTTTKKTTSAKSSTKSSPIKVSMTMDRDTKTTRRFQADEDDAPITTLYVKQSAFKGGLPDTITVSVVAE